MGTTLFESYGGFAQVRKIVSDFYDRILDNPELSRHFAGADMRRLIDHQTQFISQVMGGPAAYTDETLQRVHAALGITPAEFRAMVETFVDTLEEFELPAGDIAVLRRELERREVFIVSRRG